MLVARRDDKRNFSAQVIEIEQACQTRGPVGTLDSSNKEKRKIMKKIKSNFQFVSQFRKRMRIGCLS